MREIAFKILDYFYENERARNWWMYVSFIGLTLSAYSLSWWQYALVILFGVMLQWHGLVEGAQSAIDGVEGKDK